MWFIAVSLPSQKLGWSAGHSKGTESRVIVDITDFDSTKSSSTFDFVGLSPLKRHKLQLL